MKILVCCDELPFPARNGVTIPSAAYIRLLAKEHTVDCVYLREEKNKQFDEYIKTTSLEVRKLFVFNRRRKSKLFQAFSELILGRPSFHAWSYAAHPSSLGVDFSQYDAIIGTPISTLDFCFKIAKNNQRIVGAVSDIYTAVLTNSFNLRSREGRGGLFERLRISRMAGIESRLLSRCSAVLVQTNLDIEWARQIGGETLAKRTFSIPNGVSEELLEWNKKKSIPAPVLLFAISSFSDPLYRRNLYSFVIEIWPTVKNMVPDARLRITGKGLEKDQQLYKLLKEDNQVDLVGFVPNLQDVYHGIRVALAPIYKSYGYINKVAEAMAVGVPVVGDASAFNGLEATYKLSFATIAEGEKEFIDAIVLYLTDDGYWQKASEEARTFAIQNLAWKARYPTLISAINRSY